MQNGIAVLRQQLVKQNSVTEPVLHRHRPRAPIRVQNQRHTGHIGLPLRQQQRRVECHPVRRLRLQHLRRAQPPHIQRLCRPKQIALSPVLAKAHRRGRKPARRPVHKRSSARRKRPRVYPRRSRQLLFLSRKAHLPKLLLQHLPFVRVVVHRLVRPIHAQHRVHIPVALGQLPLQLRRSSHRRIHVIAVKVDVRMPIRPARQHNRPILNRHIVLVVEELLVLFLQHQLRVPRLRFRKVQILVLVVPRQRLHPNRLWVHPPKSRNIILPACECAWKLHPNRLPAMLGHNPHPHLRIRVPRLRIPLLVHRRMRRNPVRNRILRHMLLIHLQIHEMRRIRRPEVVAPYIQLFLINPIHLAIQNRGVGRRGQVHRRRP